jgi:hypothetical protein
VWIEQSGEAEVYWSWNKENIVHLLCLAAGGFAYAAATILGLIFLYGV